MSDIPDFETAPGNNPVQFSYMLAASADLGVAGRQVTSVKRVGGVATVTLDGAWVAGEVNVGDRVSSTCRRPHRIRERLPSRLRHVCGHSFNEESRTMSRWLRSTPRIAGGSPTAQPGLPDTVVTIKEIGRFQGVTTVKTSQAHSFITGDSGTVDYPPDASFSGTFTVTDTGADKITYPNSGPDFGYTIASTKDITYVARWNNVAWVTTNGALGGIKDTAPDNRIEINGVDTTFDGVINLSVGSLHNGDKTFTYANPGPNSRARCPRSRQLRSKGQRWQGDHSTVPKHEHGSRSATGHRELEQHDVQQRRQPRDRHEDRQAATRSSTPTPERISRSRRLRAATSS